jgi:hypothetical protein
MSLACIAAFSDAFQHRALGGIVPGQQQRELLGGDVVHEFLQAPATGPRTPASLARCRQRVLAFSGTPGQHGGSARKCQEAPETASAGAPERPTMERRQEN